MNILIVDDEQHNRDGLRLLLNKYCPDVTIIGEAASASEARNIMTDKHVDVILLDINMPKENGFELLDSFPEKNFLTIFITAFAEHAIRALKANAIDYLLKPIDENELIAAIVKCKKYLRQLQNNDEALSIYKASLHNVTQDVVSNNYPKKLTLPFTNGFQILDVNELTHLEAEGNYTKLHFHNETFILASKPIKDFEEILDPVQFFRIHKSSMINIDYLKSYSSADGHEVILNNGVRLPLSRRRIEDFQLVLSNISKKV